MTHTRSGCSYIAQMICADHGFNTDLVPIEQTADPAGPVAYRSFMKDSCTGFSSLSSVAHLFQNSHMLVAGLGTFAFLTVAAIELQRHMIASLILGNILTLIARWKACRPVIHLFSIGAASGDRTHDILSHSQAFCL